MMKKDEINIFSFLRGMTTEKRDFDFNDPEVNKIYDQRMINRWVSMNELFIQAANIANRFKNVSNEMHYEFYKSLLPKKFIKFTYIKRVKDKDDRSKKCLMKYYNITQRECEMYIQVLSDKQIKEIVDIYKGIEL